MQTCGEVGVGWLAGGCLGLPLSPGTITIQRVLHFDFRAVNRAKQLSAAHNRMRESCYDVAALATPLGYEFMQRT